MSSITAILEADANGVLHLALPEELRKSKLVVTATTQVASDSCERPTKQDALAALQKLRELGTFKQITDPIAWQREIRKDRPLGGKH